jgi:hypothetical protein
MQEKQKVKNKAKEDTKSTTTALKEVIQNQARRIVQNVTTLRSDLIRALTSSTRDINQECNYPDNITIGDYKAYYNREGIATRVVNIFPDESWTKDPIIWETPEKGETEFESAWNAFQEKYRVWHYLHRIDRLSGIGDFGILLFGTSDGGNLQTPLSDSVKDLELLYLRPFDEYVTTIHATDENLNSPRFGQPVMYQVQFEGTGGDGTGKSQLIHYSRVLHVADLRQMSEVYGTPRMRSVYNRLADLEKILGGSGEMFWKGAFPGYSFEVDPEVTTGNITTDELAESIREQIESYQEGLQRYLMTAGTKVTSLLPQMANPANHFITMVRAIALSLGVPHRIFLGSEEAKLASSTDREAWMERIGFRQDNYLTPSLVRPFIDRMIALGILPEPKNGYTVTWPPLTVPNEKDKAEVSNLQAEAMQRYVQSGSSALIPPLEFLVMFLGLDKEKAELLAKDVDMDKLQSAAFTTQKRDTRENVDGVGEGDNAPL